MDSKNIKRIAIAGVGGIGGFFAQYFYEMGAVRNQFPFTSYTIDLYDSDGVDDSNLLHQNYTLEDVGKPKAELIAARYHGLYTPKIEYLTEKMFDKYQMIFSCVDSMGFRKSLYEYGWENPEKVFWIDGRCTSRIGAVFNAAIPQQTLRKYLTDTNEQGGCLLKFEKEQMISHAMPLVVAGLMVQTWLNFYRGEKTNEHVFRV